MFPVSIFSSSQKITKYLNPRPETRLPQSLLAAIVSLRKKQTSETSQPRYGTRNVEPVNDVIDTNPDIESDGMGSRANSEKVIDINAVVDDKIR